MREDRAMEAGPTRQGPWPQAWSTGRWLGLEAAAVLPMLCLVLLTGVAYGDTLTYWWTGPDTFTLIVSSRIESWGDLTRLLTEPMMAGTGFMEIGSFFRPVTGLSYALDWALWGLDPTGYHATNLVLHTGAVLLTYVLAQRLTGGATGVSFSAAAIFTLHPMVAESLPAISRRQDALATVLLLGALLAYLRAREPGGRARVALGVSLVLGLLAYGAKEVALVLPGIVLAHAWLLDERAPGTPISQARVRWSLAQATPHLLIWAAFVAYRGWVLGGMGGYVGRTGLFSGVVAWQQGQFITSLLPPLRVIQVEMAMPGDELALLLATTTLLLVGLGLAATGFSPRELGRQASALARTHEGQVAVFCGAWLLTGALLFLVARTFTMWSVYQFLIPLSLGGAVLGAAALRAAPALPWSANRSPGRVGHRLATLACLLGAGFLVVSLAVSPAVRGEQDWETNGEVQRTLLPMLSQELAATEAQVDVLHTDTLVWFHAPSWGHPHRVETVFYFQDFTVEHWLLLDSQGVWEVDVRSNGEGILPAWPARPVVEVTPTEPGHAQFTLDVDPW